MKAPIVTVIGSLSFASGCLTVAANSDRLTTGLDLVSRTKDDASTAGIFLWQILACFEICWPLILLTCAIGYATLRVAQKPVAACVLLTLPLIAVVYTTWRLPRPSEFDISNYSYAGNVECVCTVESIVSKNSMICRSSKLVFPSNRPVEGKLHVTIFSGSSKEQLDYRPLQRLQIFGKLTPVHHTKSSWQPDPAHKLVLNGVFSHLSTEPTNVKVLADQEESECFDHAIRPGWTKFWESGRKAIIQTHVKNLGEEHGALLASMVLGDRVVQLSDDLKSLFRTVGLSHLLAASGFNLSIVVASSYFCVRLLPVPAAGASFAALISTASFVCLAGPSPSVVRAALLSVFILTAKLFHRRLHTLAALCLTLIIALVVDPLCIIDVGLQLSYVATAGIITGLQWISSKPVDKLHMRIGRWFTDTASVICIAQLSVLPLQLLYFRTAGILFLPANLLVDPVVAPVTIIGFLSSILAFVLSWIPTGITNGSATNGFAIIGVLDWLTSFPLEYMIRCAALLAQVEGTILRFPPPVPGAIFTYYASLAYFLHALPKRHLRLTGILALSIGFSILLFRPDLTGEILCLSTSTATLVSQKNATILSQNNADWLSKQLIAYCGCRRLTSKIEVDELDTTYFDARQKQFNVSRLDLRDFTLVYLKPQTVLESSTTSIKSGAKRSSNHLTSASSRKPLTWQQMTIFASSARTSKISKPIVIWTKGRSTSLRRHWSNKEIYIASVNRNPLLISKEAQPKTTSETRFYPFRLSAKCGPLLVLN
jgi:ComEC/Rec2-related protein